MENNNTKITGKIFLLRVGIASLIVAVCILFVMCIFDIIQFKFINNTKFKSAFTVISAFAVTIYFLINCRKRKNIPIGWKKPIFMSFYFEAIGYWWCGSMLGSLSMLLGFVFLIFGLFSMYKYGLR